MHQCGRNSSLQEVVALLSAGRRWVVAAHFNPDPDAYGAMCGLSLALRQCGKETALVNESGILPIYGFIPGIEEVQKQLPSGDWDGAIVCDCGDADRVGEVLKPELLKVRPLINIDHHISNDFFGDLNYVRGDACSSCELVLEVVDALGVTLTPEIAKCLLTGIIGDTGLFRYSSVTAQTFSIAEKLERAGAGAHTIARALYGDRPISAVRLKAEVLRNLKLHFEGRVSEALITNEIMSACGAGPADCESLVEAARDIAGVVIAVSIRRDKDLWKVSLRSKDERINLSDLAAGFGGGGHRQAAAFRWRGELEDLRSQLLARLCEELQKL
ncbi:MAG: bifunctional oligoribonuclease/PAP phosphatase NrnA [Deltaproteobacteria bacterium]|nr:bifunctional oligoribonuclease/PAP phosphatase NrnA [Deltaproteobacteria bacterium]